MKDPITIGLENVSLRDVELVGGKGASLGELIGQLTAMGIKVPSGFAITVHAYWQFLEFNNLQPVIDAALQSIDVDDLVALRRCGLHIRQQISNGKFPHDLAEEITLQYRQLSQQYGQDGTDVAVRSSATAEDLPDNSFAGQQETFLNIRGPESLLDAVRKCFASLFTDRAISYRSHFNFDHFSVALSIVVQKMVRSDLASSGVAFSIDTESGFKDVVIINATYGLGELLVQGGVSPDEYVVFKPTLMTGFPSIIDKKLGKKSAKMVYGESPGQLTRTVNVQKEHSDVFCLAEQHVLQLATWVTRIEEHYSQQKGHWCPMDVEWAIDGLTGDLFIVQARPETIHSRRRQGVMIEYVMPHGLSQNELLRGTAVGDKIGSGKVVIMYGMDGRDGSHDAVDFEPGDVLVTDMTDPDWEPVMKKASAIITNQGGRTCHAAIVARELGVPAVVGTGNATGILRDGMLITVSCAQGDVGFVYDGLLPFEKIETNLNTLPSVSTPILLNLASPDHAFKYASIPNRGIGLAREEFIINNFIKVHPMALLRHRQLDDRILSTKIEEYIAGYESEQDYFIKKLSYGIAKIAAAVYPNRAIVRFSDFKSNEYANLLGGNHFEPNEENPMIGWRGASRYYSPGFKEAFVMECLAIRNVRERLGLSNVAVMIPFCRTVGELHKVYQVMAESGLKRGASGLEVYLMAELPSNIILAEDFAQYIDGFSIGSNDLTQLVLGIDRDSSLVSHLYDERNPAVKQMISHLIKVAKRNGVKVGICGQGPSDFPDFAEFLAGEGIDGISVTPDSVLKVIRTLSDFESRKLMENPLVRRPRKSCS